MEKTTFDFDDQASGFDARAGLPPDAARAAARAVAACAPSLGGLLVDLGAGTGTLGVALAELGRPYLGLDLSFPMLRAFHERLGAGQAKLLIAADADQTWPIGTGRAGIVFSSRAAHLLDRDHLVGELLRVARPEGAVLALGRVRRDPDGIRATLRREMRRLLAERGIEGRSGERGHRRLVRALEARGARALAPRTVASWATEERPSDSLQAWREKKGLAGVGLDPELQRGVLEELESWARNRWDDLELRESAEESYELMAVNLPPRREGE